MPAKTDQAVIDQVTDLYHIKGYGCGQIALKLNLDPRQVSRMLNKYGSPHEHKPYRLPKFDGWDFVHENIDVGRL